MKKPKFQVGSFVTSKFGIYQVFKARFRPLAKQWIYQLKGIESQWFADSILKSQSECPNCKTIGWDWHIGCTECGLCPEDVIY